MKYKKGMRVELVADDPEMEIAIGEQGTIVYSSTGRRTVVGVEWDKEGPRRHDCSGSGLDKHCWQIPARCVCPLDTNLPAEFKAIAKYISVKDMRPVLRLLWTYTGRTEEKVEKLLNIATQVRDEEIAGLRDRIKNSALLPKGCGGTEYIKSNLNVMNLWNDGVAVAMKATIHFKQYSVGGIVATLPKELQLKQEGWLVATFENDGTLKDCTFMDEDMSDTQKSFHCGSEICMGSLTAKLSKTMKLSDPNSISKGLRELEETLQLINTDSLLNEPRGDEFSELRQFIDDQIEPEEEEEEE